MSKKPRWTSDQIKNSGLIETDKGFVKSNKLIDKKPEKLPLLIEQMTPYVEQLTDAQNKMKAIIEKEVSEKQKKLPSLIERAIPDVSKSNPRVKNAKKTEAHGIVFDSKLESYMYGLLEASGIQFEHQKVFVVQDKFNYNGETIRAIKCIVDFWLPEHNMIIDSKGFHTDVSKLKYKILKAHLIDHYGGFQNLLPKIEMPKNKAECDILIKKILFDK